MYLEIVNMFFALMFYILHYKSMVQSEIYIPYLLYFTWKMGLRGA